MTITKYAAPMMVALLSTSAIADVTIGGDFEWSYQDNDSAKSTAVDADINIKPSITTDTGMTISADFNIKCIKLISNLLDLDLDYKISGEYVEKTNDIIDLRDLSNARKEKKIDTPKYIQVFESKHGYINNLSILDLLFSEGPNSVSLITN